MKIVVEARQHVLAIFLGIPRVYHPYLARQIVVHQGPVACPLLLRTQRALAREDITRDLCRRLTAGRASKFGLTPNGT